jgi:hypothetical protein
MAMKRTRLDLTLLGQFTKMTTRPEFQSTELAGTI